MKGEKFVLIQNKSFPMSSLNIVERDKEIMYIYIRGDDPTYSVWKNIGGLHG